MISSVSPRSRAILIPLAFIAFVSLGLPDCVMGVAWPSIRAEFAQPLSRLGWLSAGGMVGYLISGFFGGQVVRIAGVGGLLVGSSLIVTASLVGYAIAPAWWVVVACAVAGGLGAGAIDTGINTFAASHFSPRVVNWLHASWGVGASAGPLLMTAVLATHHGWRPGYGILAVAMLGLCALFAVTSALWRDDGATEDAPLARRDGASLAQAVRAPGVWLRACLFFVYAGLESTAGQLLFTLFTEARGVSVPAAGVTVGGYWAALTAGRVVFGQLAASFDRHAVVRAGLMLAAAATAVIVWNPAEWVSVAAVAVLGFALGPVFPTLISATPQAVGPRLAPHVVGFQIAAASLGIGILPGLVSLLARYVGIQTIAPCLFVTACTLIALFELTARSGQTTPVATPAATTSANA